MKLNVREAARLLSLSESDLYHWVSSGEIPCYLVNEQPLFSRAELLEWALARRRPVSLGLFEHGDDEGAPLGLAEALERGGIHHGVRGQDRAALLRAVVDRFPIPDAEDKELLAQVLLARESLGSTGIGEGIAIPHVRSPLVFAGAAGAVCLCFLEHPVPFDAIDGKPVHTVFAVLSPTIRGHLQILSRLSLALLDDRFRAAVLRRAGRDELIAEARRVDASVAHEPTGVVAGTGPAGR